MTQKPDNPPAMMTNEQLAEALRTKADMINMGERIAWGSETALMHQAADVIQQQREVMRKDHDYVEMADYSKDMESLADQAANIIAMQRHEIDQLKMQIHRLIVAAGTITMNRHEMLDYERTEIEMCVDVSQNAIVYRALPHTTNGGTVSERGK